MAAPSAFISHADEDALIAYELATHLERRGIACWVAPRDVTPGRDYAAEIVAGIERCGVFVLLLSSEANRSAFVRREVERAASKNKPMFPVRIENVAPEPALEFFISSSHWIDALETPRDAEWERLGQAIKGERRADAAGFPRAREQPRYRPGRRALVVAAGIGALVAVVGIRLLGSGATDGGTGPDNRSGDGTPTADAPPSTPAPARGDLDRLIELGRRGELGERGEIGRDRPTAPRELARPDATRPDARGSGAARSDTAPAGVTGAISDEVEPCPENLALLPDLPTPLTCRCSAEAARDGTVWGSDIYTSDSNLCVAARHAGAIPASGGDVTVERLPGRDLYPGTSRNGVRTHDYGRYVASIRFAGTPAPPDPQPCPERVSINPDLATPYTCFCSDFAVREGTVWGTDLYTADSSICRAALHAGKVSTGGGEVTVDYEDGRERYVGSRRNGVGTHDYGPYAASIRFR